MSGVESARGVAAVLVVLYHASLHLEQNVGGHVSYGIAHFGHAGVDFFFVLSGFIITFVHRADFGNPGRLGHYVQRRFTRVFPFYWIVLIYYLADLLLFHRPQFPGGREIFLDTLLLPHATEPVVGGAWTLVFEVLFYAVMAVTICSRAAGTVVLSLWGLLVAFGFASGHEWHTPILRVMSSPFCLEFFLGIGSAYLLAKHRISHSGTILLAGITAFAMAGLAEVTGLLNGFGPAARVAYGCSAVLIVVGLVERERSGLLRVPRAMALVGQASYAIYLVHLVAIGIAFKFLSRSIHLTAAWSTVLWLALSVLAVAAGVLASIWLEQPSIRFFRQRLAGKPRAAVSLSA